MACLFPITAFYAKEINPTGKRSLIFNKSHSHSGLPIKIPCQQCINCKIEKSRQWAMRCTHEAQLHEQNMFLTLTYDDDNLPSDGSLVPTDLQLFHKRLHNRLLRRSATGIRYYACGEYGDDNNRPHYHSLIFSYSFPNQTKFKTTKTGETLYTAPDLDELWPYGLAVIGAVTFESAQYVAGYINKKITGPKAEDHYQGRIPEYSVMSRRPGIGLNWLKKHLDQTYTTDSVLFRGKLMKPPKYYDKKFAELDTISHGIIKHSRWRHAKRDLANQTPERRKVREKVAKAKINLFKRNAA